MRRYFSVLIIIIAFFAIQAVALAQAPITATLYLDFSTINDLSYFDPYPDMPVMTGSGDPAKLQQLSIDNTTGNVITGSLLMAHIDSDSSGTATWTFDVSGRYGDVLANDTEVSIAAYKSGAGIDSWHHPEIKIYFTDGTYISTLRDVNVHSITTSWSTVSIADGNVDGFYVDSVVGFPNVTGWGSYASKYIDKIDIVFGFSDGQGDPTKDAYLHIDDFTLTLKNYVPVNGGGGGSCPTVDDYNFNVGYGYPSATDAWVNPYLSADVGDIVYALAPISGDGAASLSTYDLIAQTLDITDTDKYTITLSARVLDPEYQGVLEVGIGESLHAIAEYNSQGLDFNNLTQESFDALHSRFAVVTDTVYSTFTGTVSSDSLQHYLYLDVPKRPDGVTGSVEVDWVCVEASNNTNVCTSPSKVDFDFEGGTNDDTGGLSQGWKYIDYAEFNDYTYRNIFPHYDILNSAYNGHRGFYATSIGLFGFPAEDVTAITYIDPVVPRTITATVVYPPNTNMKLSLYLYDKNGWNQLDLQVFVDGGTQFGDSLIDDFVFDIPTIYESYPYKIALALNTWSDDLSSVGRQRMGFDDISVSGCFSGDPATGDCVLNDPDLDEDAGFPNSLYWFGDFGTEQSSAYLTAGNVIAQNILAPQAQTYQLNMTASQFAIGACDFSIQLRDYGSANILREYNYPCKTGLMQNYTFPIDLPATPVEFSIHQNTGEMQIDYVCLASPTQPNCLNQNPIFTAGAVGYSGNFNVIDGVAVIDSMQSLRSNSVPLAEKSTYQLAITAEPISGTTNVVINDSAEPPTILSVGTTISATTSITHVFTGKLGYAPAVWNYTNPYGESLKISKYCITEITSTVYYGGKNCVTIDNADFDNGLQGWIKSNITGVGGYAVFGGAGGSLLSTVVNVSNVSENYIRYPSLSVAWTQQSIHTSVVNDIYRTGGQSMKVHKATGDTGYSAYPANDSSVNTLADGDSLTLSAYIYLPSNSVATDVKIRIKDAINGISYWSDEVTATDEWTLATVTFANSTGATVNIQYSLNIKGTAGDDCYYYLDNAQITKTSQPQPYIDGDMPWCEWTGTPHVSTSKCAAPFDATVHIIGKSPTTTPVSATVTVSSTGSAESVTNQFAYGMIPTEHFDNFTVGGGDMQVSINADAGFELDYICVIPGEFTEPGEPGTGGGITIGDGQCAPPPMTIQGNLPVSGWLSGIWIWDSTTPSNYEIVQSYSAGWLRYIGCEMTSIGKMVEGKLDIILEKLTGIGILQAINAFASSLSAAADIFNLLEGTVEELISALIEDGISIALILGALLLFLGALMSVISLVIGLIYLFWMIPQEFWTALWNSVRGADAVILPLPTSPDDPLYNIYIGFQMFNQTIAPTWLFTITVIVIALGSISLIWWTINRIQIKW